MKCCLECGRHDPVLVEFGGLRVSDQPPAAYWGGERLPLTAGEARMLHRCVARREVSYSALEMLCDENVDASALIKTRMSRIRQKFRAAQVGIEIITEEGWGYRLMSIQQ